MKVFVTGGTGFVGSRLLPALIEAGHTPVLLARAHERTGGLPDPVEKIVGDPGRPGPWWAGVRECGAAVNLAGHPVFDRWTPEVKAQIRESRLATTRNLVGSLPSGRSFTLVNASGIGIYGDRRDEILDEAAPPGDGFLARVAREWEVEASRAPSPETRVCLARFGIVLGSGGGALEQMVRATHLFVGGRLGSGRQWMPWIHREDVIRGILFLLERRDLEGPFNFAAPHPSRQAEVARTLARLMARPALASVPRLALRFAIGECAEIVLASQRATPRRLLEAGFTFHFPELEEALREILPRYGIRPVAGQPPSSE